MADKKSESQKEYERKYYLENKEKFKKRNKKNYLKNKNSYIERATNWIKNNPKKRKMITKKYRSNNKEKLKKYRREYDKKRYQTVNGRYGDYKRQAKKRGLLFEIDIKQFAELINLPCYYCGEKGGGIDRVDSTKGYLKDNVVPCCIVCNRMKFTYPVEDFINYCKKVVEKNER